MHRTLVYGAIVGAACLAVCVATEAVAQSAKGEQALNYVKAMNQAAAACKEDEYDKNSMALSDLINSESDSTNKAILTGLQQTAKPYVNPCPPKESASRRRRLQRQEMAAFIIRSKMNNVFPTSLVGTPLQGPGGFVGSLGFFSDTADPQYAAFIQKMRELRIASGGTVYAGGSVGGAQSCIERRNVFLETHFGVDPTDQGAVSGCSSSLSGGVMVGMNLFTFPIGTVPVMIGGEFAADWLTNGSGFIGNTPNTTLGMNTDQWSGHLNNVQTVSGIVTVPLTPNIAIFGRGGWAHGNADITFNSNSTNIAAGVPPGVATQSLAFNGTVFGVGAQGQWITLGNGLPIFVRFEWQHLSFDSQTFSAGTPSLVFTSATMQPHSDLFKVTFIAPVGEIFAPRVNGDTLLPVRDSSIFAAPSNTRFVAPSDIRLKHDIVRVGQLDNGLGLYRYKYIWSDQEFVGVIAQEVQAVFPDAVAQGDDGYLRVDYARLGMRLMTRDEFEWVRSAQQTTWVRSGSVRNWPDDPARRSCAAPPNQDFAMIVAALQDGLDQTIVR